MTQSLIGAGLGRTGTASLKVALEQLLGGRCYHMSEGYVACVDYPACGHWRELAEHYPDAKVLLSVRDADKWFESTRETIFSDECRELSDLTPDKAFFRENVFDRFVGHFGDRAFMTSYFNRHTDEVQRTIPKERLLVYQVGDGWEPLCAFLGVPVPDTPFPHVNAREEFARVIQGMRQAVEAGEHGLAEARGMARGFHD